MKVCTDSCILGAWASLRIGGCTKLLDIGAGTGLLMLMLAQRSEAEIHGIEIDADSFSQLEENLKQKNPGIPFKVFNEDARNFGTDPLYDCIISNPPFFENDLLSITKGQQLAKHSSELRLLELTEMIDRNLSTTGKFMLLLPFHRDEEFAKLAHTAGFYLQEKLVVRHTAQHDPFRVLVHYSRKPIEKLPEKLLTIKNLDGSYTNDFVELLKDYYLHL